MKITQKEKEWIFEQMRSEIRGQRTDFYDLDERASLGHWFAHHKFADRKFLYNLYKKLKKGE